MALTAMLLTARLCLDRDYYVSISCPRCRSLRVIYVGFPQRVIAKGKGDVALRQLFEDGVFVCREHKVPAIFMSVSRDRDSTVDEIAVWRRS